MQERNYNLKSMTKRPYLLLLAISVILITGAIIMTSSCATVGASVKGIRLERTQASPNYRTDRFVNTLPSIELPILDAMVEWVKGGEHLTPEEALPVVHHDREDFSELPSDGLRITWLGHSSSLIEIDGKRFLTDPMWSQRSSPLSWAGPKRFFDPPLALEDLPPIDTVLISHDHYDHLDKTTVKRLAETGTSFIVPLGVGAHLEGWGIESRRIVELDWWESKKIGELNIIATPARHFSGRSPILTDRDRTLWAGFAILGPEHRVYYSGDTTMFEGFKEIGEKLGPFDAALIEVGAYHRLWADLHIGPEQAVQALQMVKGKLLIPVHWGTFNLAMHSWTEPAERLIVAAEQAGAGLAIPRPGESLNPTSPPALTRWWPALPWQSAEEHPIVSSGFESVRTASADRPENTLVNASLVQP